MAARCGVEIGAVVTSLDPAVDASTSEEEAAKTEIDALIYDTRNRGRDIRGAAGSGPFRIAAWDREDTVLAANDDYQAARPFVDSIEIRMGRAARDRLLDLEPKRSTCWRFPRSRSAARRARRPREPSQPDELLAIVFVAGRPAAEDARIARSDGPFD